jgi:hypothetical protein
MTSSSACKLVFMATTAAGRVVAIAGGGFIGHSGIAQATVTWLIRLGTAGLLLASQAHPQPPDTTTELWRTDTPQSQGFSPERLEALRADLAARSTKALLVIRARRDCV